MNAQTAVLLLKQSGFSEKMKINSAATHANQHTEERQVLTMSKEFAQYAEENSTQTSSDRVPPVRLIAVKSIESCGTADVYNMEVEHNHNFAVNRGYIVHNCIDAVRYACNRIWKRRGQ